ncbi:hypothetical protein L6164_005177 [Bauhinia variegata]|uniref:Uncharacterized protein n=1 Tax=Bauhinia variegata TaxID=167791 RepID=A0ACB9PQH0_BAUVA|nr:hypothetical protein L6164_005177 [Bauhinia variegata]
MVVFSDLDASLFCFKLFQRLPLKELEKLVPKKGVIIQSVKDVVQSLVDDDLVLKDKIGTSVPSCAGNLLKELEKLVPKKGVIIQSVKDVVQSLVDDDLVLKDKIGTSLRSVCRKLESDIENKEAIQVARAAANRWTDNVFILKQWCSNNFPQDKEQLENLYKEVGITDDFDYMELQSLPLGVVGD